MRYFAAVVEHVAVGLQQEEVARACRLGRGCTLLPGQQEVRLEDECLPLGACNSLEVGMSPAVVK